MYQQTFRDSNLRMRLILKNNFKDSLPSNFFEAVIHRTKTEYPMWNDVRTYLTSEIDPKEKTALLNAISYFKKKEGK